MNYNFIAIEGNIGSGKTSLSKMISNDFNAKLVLERFEDNSFLPKFYSDPDKFAFPLEMSFLADRYQQLKNLISMKDLFSSFTISDYFIDKSLIFAGKTLKKDEFRLYSRLFEIITASLPKPDIIVYLFASVGQLRENISKRGRPYEQNIPDSYLEKIQQGYLDHFKILSKRTILIIDTNEIDFVNNQNDYEKIVQVIQRNYPNGIHRINLNRLKKP